MVSLEKHFEGRDFDIAMNQFVYAFEKKVLKALPHNEQMEINGLIQMYRLKQLERGSLINRLVEAAKLEGFDSEIPEVLKPQAKQAQTLQTIKGTKLFDELSVLEESLKDALPENEAERELLTKAFELSLLHDFAKLELIPEDWQQVKGCVVSGGLCEISLLPP